MEMSNKKLIIFLSAIILIFVIFTGYLFLGNNIGISKNNIVSDIRNSQKIEDDWTTYGETTDEIAAYVSYPKDKSEHTYSIYVNRKGLSFGYFFRAGGSNSAIDNSIAEFTIDGYDNKAYISLNNHNVVQLRIDNGNNVKTQEIKINEPFVFILPKNAGEISFYDKDGNVVEYVNYAE